VRRRLELQKPSPELLEHYQGAGKLVKVNGEESVETVTQEVLAALALVKA